MKPLVVFSDPEAAVRTILLDGFEGRSEDYIPAAVTVSFPTTGLTGDATHVQVELEAADEDAFPVLERAQVRVTCYSAPGHRDNVKNLASLAHGLLLASRDIHPQLGRSDVSTDPATKNLMCWFLVRVHTRATQLA